MALCVFALIASEFMPVSLLTPMAADLGVTEGLAGRGIAVSGAFAVLASLSIASVAGRMDRRTLLLGLTGLMCLSGAVIALAPNYATYLAGRALIGVVVGGFWSLSAATAMRLVPGPQVPQALAVFNGGNALATVVAAPLGSYLGAVIGWRGAFLCLVPVAVVAFAWQWVSLPPLPAGPRAAGSANVFRLFQRRAVRRGMLSVGAFFMGQFMLFTYLRPFLETVTRVGVSTLSLMLLGIGVAGAVGTTAIGALLKRSFYPTLAAAPVAMALVAVALIAWGSQGTAVAALLGAWGLVATATPVGWWTWVARALPQDAEAGGGLMVAVVQLAIALGSTAGGWLFDASGYQSTFAAAAGMLLVAAVSVGFTARADPSAAAGAQAGP
ncbi:MFS transporter [Acidovorax sp. BLS4]|nr:MFS transporter [Paracidovorax avenae]WOI48166.1 MFS transporter [Paracidovorax avenae]